MLTAVCSVVCYELAALCKLPATRRTRVRFLAGMDPHVHHEVRAAYEAFGTQCTDKRPLTSVLLHVLRQVPGLLVALVTLQSVKQTRNQSISILIISSAEN